MFSGEVPSPKVPWPIMLRGSVTMGHYQLKPGDHLDRYTVARLIGEGGMGEVYEAVHRFTKRPVALKCLQLDRAEKGNFRERMKTEAEVLSELDHPNIVKVFDADITSSGMVWMAMELLVGKTLRELIHILGPLRIVDALYYGCEIADGVAAAHEIRVIHRDLKPENVFVTHRNEVKVLDLGTAKFYDKGLKTTDRLQILGTPYYMSPEHLLGERVDMRTDIYALGLIVYEMLVGHHPYAEVSNENLPGKHEIGQLQLHAPLKPLTTRIAGFPEELWAVIQKATAKEREARFSTMSEFAGALRAARRQAVAEEQKHETATGVGRRQTIAMPDRSDYLSGIPAPRCKTVPMSVLPRVICPASESPAPETPRDSTLMLGSLASSSQSSQVESRVTVSLERAEESLKTTVPRMGRPGAAPIVSAYATTERRTPMPWLSSGEPVERDSFHDGSLGPAQRIAAVLLTLVAAGGVALAIAGILKRPHPANAREKPALSMPVGIDTSTPHPVASEPPKRSEPVEAEASATARAAPEALPAAASDASATPLSSSAPAPRVVPAVKPLPRTGASAGTVAPKPKKKMPMELIFGAKTTHEGSPD